MGPHIECFDVGQKLLSMPGLSHSGDTRDEDEEGPQIERSSGCPKLGGAGKPRNENSMEAIYENLKPSASQLPGKVTDNVVEETVNTLSTTYCGYGARRNRGVYLR